MPLTAWITSYVAGQSRALESVPAAEIAAVIDIVRRAGRDGRRIFVCGNGGSAANAAHFVTDLGKNASEAAGRPFRVLSLADNVSWMTAIGNDYAYDDVFVRQLVNHSSPGDLLIVTSVSGSSPNLVKAAEFARREGLTTVALVGGKRGRLAEIADHILVVGDTHYGRVEDAQMNILHMICYAVVELGG
ncbi:MAG: SIS domain-containing protein [Planctomycetia bacterium]|nr:SIS domain-containing protein [Planctomycetia bacterium]